MKNSIKCFFIFTLLAFSIDAQTVDEKKYQALMNQSYIFQNEREYDKAIELVTNAINKYPDKLDLYIRRAELYRENSDLDLMENDVNKAIEISNYDERIATQGASQLLYAKRCEKALTIYNLLIIDHQKKDYLYLGRSVVFLCLKENQNALNDLNIAISLEPDNTYYKSIRNNILNLITKESAQSNSNNVLILELEQKLLVTSTVEEVFKIKNDLAVIYIDRANHFDREDKPKEMFADLDRAIELVPIWSMYKTRGQRHSSYKNHQQAIADFNKAIELEPNFAILYLLRGDTFYRAGKFSEAIKDYEKTLTLKITPRKSIIKRIEKTKQKMQPQTEH